MPPGSARAQPCILVLIKHKWTNYVPLLVCCGTNELLSYLTGVPVIIVHSLKNVNNNFTAFNPLSPKSDQRKISLCNINAL